MRVIPKTLIDGGGASTQTGFKSGPLFDDPFKQDDDNTNIPTESSTTSPSMTTWIINLLKNETELKAIYNAVRDPVTGKFLYNVGTIVDMITSSNWYLTKGPTVAGNLAGRYKFGENWYQDQINQYKITISGLATGMGLDANDPEIGDYLNSLAEASFLNSWEPAYIENEIIGNAKIVSKAAGGLYQSQIKDIADYGKLMGIDLSNTTMSDYQRRLIGSVNPQGLRVRSTPDQIKKEISDQQALLYPFFADDFVAGRTLWDLTSLHRRKWADLLEVDEDTLDWTDPLWKDGKIFTSVDEKTGKIMMRPAWDAEKLIKKDERWQYTENATRLYEDIGIKMMNKFGFTAI